MSVYESMPGSEVVTVSIRTAGLKPDEQYSKVSSLFRGRLDRRAFAHLIRRVTDDHIAFLQIPHDF